MPVGDWADCAESSSVAVQAVTSQSTSKQMMAVAAVGAPLRERLAAAMTILNLFIAFRLVYM